jgi:hypothetical protein
VRINPVNYVFYLNSKVPHDLIPSHYFVCHQIQKMLMLLRDGVNIEGFGLVIRMFELFTHNLWLQFYNHYHTNISVLTECIHCAAG